MKFKIAQDTPINRLFLAVNHYVSTGEYVGEGIAYDHGTHFQVFVSRNNTDSVDVRDFEAFQSRFQEIADEFSTALTLLHEEEPYSHYTFMVDLTDADLMAQRLLEQPGPKGWGSMYQTIREAIS